MFGIVIAASHELAPALCRSCCTAHAHPPRHQPTQERLGSCDLLLVDTELQTTGVRPPRHPGTRHAAPIGQGEEVVQHVVRMLHHHAHHQRLDHALEARVLARGAEDCPAHAAGDLVGEREELVRRHLRKHRSEVGVHVRVGAGRQPQPHELEERGEVVRVPGHQRVLAGAQGRAAVLQQGGLHVSASVALCRRQHGQLPGLPGQLGQSAVLGRLFPHRLRLQGPAGRTGEGTAPMGVIARNVRFPAHQKALTQATSSLSTTDRSTHRILSVTCSSSSSWRLSTSCLRRYSGACIAAACCVCRRSANWATRQCASQRAPGEPFR